MDNPVPLKAPRVDGMLVADGSSVPTVDVLFTPEMGVVDGLFMELGL